MYNNIKVTSRNQMYSINIYLQRGNRMQVQFPLQQDGDSCQIDQMETNNPCQTMTVTKYRKDIQKRLKLAKRSDCTKEGLRPRAQRKGKAETQH